MKLAIQGRRHSLLYDECMVTSFMMLSYRAMLLSVSDIKEHLNLIIWSGLLCRVSIKNCYMINVTDDYAFAWIQNHCNIVQIQKKAWLCYWNTSSSYDGPLQLLLLQYRIFYLLLKTRNTALVINVGIMELQQALICTEFIYLEQDNVKALLGNRKEPD